MAHALVQNGKVVDTELPEVATLKDGRQVSGFDKLPDAALKAEGWLPLVDPGPPAFDPATQDVNQTLTVQATQVVASYSVVALPPAPPLPANTQDQVDALFNLLVAKGVITQAEVDTARTAKPAV